MIILKFSINVLKTKNIHWLRIIRKEIMRQFSPTLFFQFILVREGADHGLENDEGDALYLFDKATTAL